MRTTILISALLAISACAIPVDTVHERAAAARSTACADVVVHYARGTFEAAPIGGVIGQTFQSTLAQALSDKVKTLAFEGVDYGAGVLGFLFGGDGKGSATLADSVRATAGACPDAIIVMAGYSQGAQLVHNAAEALPVSVQQRIVAVVTFGDPKRKSALPPVLEARRQTFCHDWDLICKGTVIITVAHTTYAEDALAAAAFITARI